MGCWAGADGLLDWTLPLGGYVLTYYRRRYVLTYYRRHGSTTHNLSNIFGGAYIGTLDVVVGVVVVVFFLVSVDCLCQLELL